MNYKHRSRFLLLDGLLVDGGNHNAVERDSRMLAGCIPGLGLGHWALRSLGGLCALLARAVFADLKTARLEPGGT
jgi:hypothetical protein